MQKIENLKDSFVKVYDYVIQGELGFMKLLKINILIYFRNVNECKVLNCEERFMQKR